MVVLELEEGLLEPTDPATEEILRGATKSSSMKQSSATGDR
jgi:hypothetical protein